MTERWELAAKATEFVAEEMGVALQRSALSPNIRERMDHSCAVLDPSGRIVAQAEHIPVHLGSFRVAARNLLDRVERQGPTLAPGEMLVSNDPYLTGTHLNDVTVLAPIDVGNRRVGWSITKAHYVDVGGPVPGSLNPVARTLEEEGQVIPPTRLVSRGRVDRGVLRQIRRRFGDPVTARGDLEAQMAANRRGIAGVRALVDRFGTERLRESWAETVAHGRALTRASLSRLPHASASAEDRLEGDEGPLPLRVRVTISGTRFAADFTGSHAQVESPLNAVYGVTYSATAFAARCLLPASVPTNEGFYGSLVAAAPPGSILNPRSPAAVGGGNVETAQRVADVVLRALASIVPDRIPAASSGTMMNLMMGGTRASGARWAYYETIGGGSGARPGGDGVSGVHANMTNTLNTPVEVAEREFPLEFLAYELRRRSGGSGRYRGGDGIVRAFRTTRPTTVSILAERFRTRPWGLAGGGPGRPARVTLRIGERSRPSPARATYRLPAGATVRIETPGGGGYGRAASGPARRRPRDRKTPSERGTEVPSAA